MPGEGLFLFDISSFIPYFIVMEKQQAKEVHDVKSFRELLEYWDAYMYALINEIYVGVGISLGLSEKKAYDLAKNRPGDMKKAGFFKSIFEKFKSLFSYKVPKFRPKKGQFGDGTPMTEKQWDVFNKSIDDYWKQYAHKVTEDIAVKGFMLGRETIDFRKKKKPYKNKSLYQVVEDQYSGDMPSTIQQAYKEYDFKNSEKNVLNKSFSNVAMYVNEQNNEIKEAIRKQVQAGINDNKSPTEIASDLYWNVQKDEELVNKYSAESLRRNWHRIAQTELASVYEAGILAPLEAEAMESLEDPEKAVYFVRTGGTCEFCVPLQGSVVRLLPSSVIGDTGTEKLSDIGIKDKNTNVFIYPGKNNVGRKRKDWQNCCPGHPYNIATFQQIDLKTEFYNPKTGDVEKRQVKQKFVPQMEDSSYQSKEEKKYREPTMIGENLVRHNNNIYEAVPASEYNRKLEEWRRDRSRPAPINEANKNDMKLFEVARENR